MITIQELEEKMKNETDPELLRQWEECKRVNKLTEENVKEQEELYEQTFNEKFNFENFLAKSGK